MAWIEIITVLALLQFFVFGLIVGNARVKYGVNAPALTGHDMFERAYRVQMNTLEQLAIFLPSLWMAAMHWSPTWAAAAGAVYLVGRTIYAQAYLRDPKSRSLGFALTALPTLVLLVAAGWGAVKALPA